MRTLLGSRLASLLFLGLMTFLTFVILGCGPGKGTVSGEVKFRGQALPSGAISFLCEGGDHPVLTADIIDGKYSVSGLPLGRTAIIVRTSASSGPALSMEGKIIQPDKPARKSILIPSKYGQPDKSGLTYEVKSGNQTYDINLTP